MTMDFQSPFYLAHADVLNAKPDNEESQDRLIEELKARGNASFKAKRYEEADLLYGHAIDLNAKSSSAKSLLGNRSASRCLMGKFEDALSDADAAVALDPNWVKGHFRRAQALNGMRRYAEAVGAYKEVLALEPGNKNIRQQLAEAESKANQGIEAPIRSEQKDSTSKTKKLSSSSGSAKKSTTNVPTKSQPQSAAPVGDEEEVSLSGVRGYKKLADGRTTTFFHNELSEEAKQLIGDIAPKRVEDPSQIEDGKPVVGSVWNKGGTYEEKNVTAWATSRVRQLLLQVELKDHGIEITEVQDVSGEAHISVIRGTKRYLFEFTIKLLLSTAGGPASVTLQDVNMDSVSELELEVAMTDKSNPQSAQVRQALLKRNGPFETSVTEKLRVLVSELKKM